MKREMKQKTKSTILLTILVVIYLCLEILTAVFDMKGYQSFNGVLMAFKYGVCLLMISSSQRKGTLVGILLMIISGLLLLRVVIMTQYLGLLPGVFNMIFYIITLFVISLDFKKKEKENVTDMLTGDLNRRGLYKLLRGKTDNESPFALVCVNLDNFKAINDNYGHGYGDKLLCEVSRRIEKKVGNLGTVARIGGAEYIVCLEDEKIAESFANELLDIIKEKVSITDNDMTIDCYLICYAGVTLYPKDADTAENLIKNVDIALNEAVGRKAKTACVFDEKMADVLKRQLEVERYIKDALEKDYFFTVYQPQYEMEGKKLRGFESLLRLRLPDGTMISPGEFIPVAEKGNLILQIDDYVLKRVMKEFKPIVEQNKEVMVSVNVSAKNIGSSTFIPTIKRILEETGFTPTNLEIEITEYCMVTSIDTTVDNINALRALGVEVALDDFGTGYTSLNYVSKLPINLIKIDKSLIDDITNNYNSREFAHLVISMGHIMDCHVIAEGVEDTKQLQLLREDGCDYVQGYVWGKPLGYEAAKDIALN